MCRINVGRAQSRTGIPKRSIVLVQQEIRIWEGSGEGWVRVGNNENLQEMLPPRPTE